MQVLVATRATQGRRANDFCWAHEGELVHFPTVECGRGWVDDECGCRRSMSGAETSKATTTVMVVDRADLSFDPYLAAIRASVVRDGWERNDEMEGDLWRDARDLADVALELPLGSVLERRGRLFLVRNAATESDPAEASSGEAGRREPRWPMLDPPNTGVFVARALLNGTEPLLGARHDEDGDWLFWGREEPTEDNAEDLLVLVHLAHLVDRFPEVAALAGLPRHRAAIRSSAEEAFTETD